MTEKLKVFTLYKSMWLRGEGPGESKLLRESDGKMCCVGQLAEQCGVPRELLSGAGAVHVLPGITHSGLLWLVSRCGDSEVTVSSFDADDAYEANDDTLTSDEQKIEKLRPILARHGWELRVVEGPES